MVKRNKDYWIHLYPHTYYCRKDDRALLYNTQTGERLNVSDPEILKLLEELHVVENMGAVFCKGSRIDRKPFTDFMTLFCEMKLGDVAEVASMPDKPVQMMPLVNLQSDVERFQTERPDKLAAGTLRALLQMNIYLHAECPEPCDHCERYFKQTLCCTKFSGVGQEKIDSPLLAHILSQVKYGVVGKLNVLGGNLYKHPEYMEIIRLLGEFQGKVHLWSHYAAMDQAGSLPPDLFYEVIVPFPLEQEKFERCAARLNHAPVTYHFYVTTEEEYARVCEFINGSELKKFQIHPIFIETNTDFFEKYVYSEDDDIFCEPIPFQKILAHQKLNTHFFGALTVLPGGEVCAHANGPVLGNLKTDSLLEIINKEMTINTAWRKIRDSAPCTACLNQYLCPSPSHYEQAAGRNNLCHLFEGQTPLTT